MVRSDNHSPTEITTEVRLMVRSVIPQKLDCPSSQPTRSSETSPEVGLSGLTVGGTSITLGSKFITASSAWSESCGLQRLLPTLSGFCVMRKSDSTEQHLPSHRLVTLLSPTCYYVVCCYILVLANNAYSNNRSICFALLTECNVFPSKEF